MRNQNIKHTHGSIQLEWMVQPWGSHTVLAPRPAWWTSPNHDFHESCAAKNSEHHWRVRLTNYSGNSDINEFSRTVSVCNTLFYLPLHRLMNVPKHIGLNVIQTSMFSLWDKVWPHLKKSNSTQLHISFIHWSSTIKKVQEVKKKKKHTYKSNVI